MVPKWFIRQVGWHGDKEMLKGSNNTFAMSFAQGNCSLLRTELQEKEAACILVADLLDREHVIQHRVAIDKDNGEI